MAGGPGVRNYNFDLRVAQARDEINDALRLGPTAPKQPDFMQQLGQYMNVQANPQQQMANVNVPMGGGFSAGAQVGGGQGMPYGVQNVGMNYNAPSGFSAGLNYNPQRNMVGANMRVPFQEGGLATSLRNNPQDHERDVAFVASRDQQLRDMAGKRPFAHGGYAEGGDIVVTGRRAAFDPVYTFMEDRISGDGGGFMGGGGAGGGFAGNYDIGGLQAAINAATKNAPRAPIQAPKQPSGPSAPAVLDLGRVGGAMKPSYGGGQADVMRIMDLERNIAGAPKGVGARLGIGFAKGGGAWTRKEGKNPEGGLNAVGRASLRAQGHDIKPPVSAKQAKKSPKAAARRKSFCARMSGMPGPMKDEKGRPTRKALSLRKWDC